MQFVASGVAGVVNMSMNPVFLFAFAILFGQERAGLRHLLALVLGIAGLVILFSGKASFGGSEIECGPRPRSSAARSPIRSARCSRVRCSSGSRR